MGTKNGRGKPPAGKDDSSALRIRLRGKDNAPLSIAELREAA